MKKNTKKFLSLLVATSIIMVPFSSIATEVDEGQGTESNITNDGEDTAPQVNEPSLGGESAPETNESSTNNESATQTPEEKIEITFESDSLSGLLPIDLPFLNKQAKEKFVKGDSLPGINYKGESIMPTHFWEQKGLGSLIPPSKFLAWNTAKNGSGTWYRGGQALTEEDIKKGNFTLYQQYVNQSSLNYLINEGTLKPILSINDSSNHTTEETAYNTARDLELNYAISFNENLGTLLSPFWGRIDTLDISDAVITIKVDNRVVFDDDLSLTFKSTWLKPKNYSSKSDSEYTVKVDTDKPTKDGDYSIYEIPFEMVSKSDIADMSYEEFIEPITLTSNTDLNSIIKEDSYKKIAESNNPIVKMESGISLKQTIKDIDKQDGSNSVEDSLVKANSTPQYLKLHTSNSTKVDVDTEWVGDEKDSITLKLVKQSIVIEGDEEKIEEEVIETKKIKKNKDSWKYTFEDLPKLEDGKEIIYDIKADDVEGYNLYKTGDFKEGFNLKFVDKTLETMPLDTVLDKVNHYGYMEGYPGDTIRPDGNITRAEVATLYYRMFVDQAREIYWTSENDYSDVKSEAWYNNAVSTLANTEVITGYPNGSFDPDGQITRAEFAKITAKFLPEDIKHTAVNLNDISGHWAEENISKLVSAGIINGYEDNSFRPENKITRAEAAKMVNGILERKPHKDHLMSGMKVWTDNSDTNAWYYAHIQEATSSHEYELSSNKEYEIWKKILPAKNWSSLERSWAENYSK